MIMVGGCCLSQSVEFSAGDVFSGLKRCLLILAPFCYAALFFRLRLISSDCFCGAHAFSSSSSCILLVNVVFSKYGALLLPK